METYQKFGATNTTGATDECGNNEISKLDNDGAEAPRIIDSATRATGSTSEPVTDVATAQVLPGRPFNANKLERAVAQVAPVAPKNSKEQKIDDGMGAENFLAAIRTFWPEARMLTQDERDGDAQFREQLILLRRKREGLCQPHTVGS